MGPARLSDRRTTTGRHRVSRRRAPSTQAGRQGSQVAPNACESMAAPTTPPTQAIKHPPIDTGIDRPETPLDENARNFVSRYFQWRRGWDSNPRPSGYEPNEPPEGILRGYKPVTLTRRNDTISPQPGNEQRRHRVSWYLNRTAHRHSFRICDNSASVILIREFDRA